MTHIGQKLALRPVRGLGRVLRPLQFFFDLFVCRNVGHGADHPARHSLLVSHNHRAIENERISSVRPAEPILGRPVIFSRQRKGEARRAARLIGAAYACLEEKDLAVFYDLRTLRKVMGKSWPSFIFGAKWASG